MEKLRQSMSANIAEMKNRKAAEKLWKSCGKAVEKLWKSCGKAVEKLRKSCGKAVDNEKLLS